MGERYNYNVTIPDLDADVSGLRDADQEVFSLLRDVMLGLRPMPPDIGKELGYSDQTASQCIVNLALEGFIRMRMSPEEADRWLASPDGRDAQRRVSNARAVLVDDAEPEPFEMEAVPDEAPRRFGWLVSLWRRAAVYIRSLRTP